MGKKMKQPESLYEQILDQQRSITTPARDVALRDGLVLTILRAAIGKCGMPDTVAGIHDSAEAAYMMADAMMAARKTREKGDFAAVEAWAQDESERGVLLYTHGEVLAALLLKRFGGSMEFAIEEIVAMQEGGSTLKYDEDRERGTVAFTLKDAKA